jgi:hypothetical protein
MTLNVPPKIRVALYVLTALGAPFIAYVKAKHYIGDLEVTLWSGEVTVVNVLAALNVTNKEIR